MTETVLGNKDVNPFDLMRECGEKLISNSQIRFYQLTAENFYLNLKKFPDEAKSRKLSQFDGSFCACVGGVFRSLRMARYLEQKGVHLANKNCRNGYRIEDLENLIDKSEIDENGFIKPLVFSNPITNLFIGISDIEECEGCLLPLLNILLKKNINPSKEIKLNIFIIEGDESSSASIYRELRAYDPELDGPGQASTFKGI